MLMPSSTAGDETLVPPLADSHPPPAEEAEAEGEKESTIRDINVYGSDIAKFLRRHPPVTGGRLSHTLFTGGTCFVSSTLRDGQVHDDRTVMHQRLADSMRNGTMPAIQEIHTIKFPMYLDVDMKTNVPRCSKDAVRHMGKVMNSKMRQFFPELNGLRLLVCTKTKGGTHIGDGVFKHGMHFHWPDVIVIVEKALQIRNGIVRGLDLVDDWTPYFGARSLDWEEIIDKAVYRPHHRDERSGGLRLVGAPKARKCTDCRFPMAKRPRKQGASSAITGVEDEVIPFCTTCENKNEHYIVDDNVYTLTDVLVDSEVNEELCARINGNLVRLLRLTSVRAPDVVQETSGYVLYEKSLVDTTVFHSSTARGGGYDGKRKVGGSTTAARGVPPTKRAVGGYNEVVGNHEVTTIMRDLLVKHSDKYKDSKMRILFDGKHRYKVLLTGDGARYCLNKKDFHSQNHVYMEVFKKGSSLDFRTHMRCWSSNPTVYSPSGMTCKCFSSQPQLRVYQADAVRLFVDAAATRRPSDVVSFEQRHLALERQHQELLRKQEARRL